MTLPSDALREELAEANRKLAVALAKIIELEVKLLLLHKIAAIGI
jgi:hypothetical protein